MIIMRNGGTKSASHEPKGTNSDLVEFRTLKAQVQNRAEKTANDKSNIGPEGVYGLRSSANLHFMKKFKQFPLLMMNNAKLGVETTLFYSCWDI